MREFWTWVGIVLVLIFLAAVLWWHPVYAADNPTPTTTPTTTMSCVSPANVTGQLESHGAKVWPIEGLRAVRLLSIVNHMAPPTDYHAATVLAAFPPDGKTVDAQGQPIMLLFLVNNGCVENEKITLRVKVAIAVMRETFGQGDVQPFGRRDITRIHDIYTGVRGKNRQLCCGGTDCNRVEYRMRDDGAEFLVGGDPWGTPKEWVFVKSEQITYLPVPGDTTGDAHFCARLATPEELAIHNERVVGRYWLYCAFIPPGGV